MSGNNEAESKQSNDIRTLTMRQAVSQRPGMYFGGTGSEAMHLLVWAVIDHAADEALRGDCTHIDVTLEDAHTISIRDDGLGLPVEVDEETGRPWLESILGAPCKQFPLPSSTPRSIMSNMQLCVANMACAELTAEVKRDGFVWRQQYKEGQPQSGLQQIRPLASEEKSGTLITFSPDLSVFEPNDLDYERISRRLRELVFLIPNLTTTLEDKRTSTKRRIDKFKYPHGLKDYVRYLNRDYPVLHEPIAIRKKVALSRDYEPLPYSATIGVALQFAQVHQPVLLGFVNTFDVEQGGTFMKGFIWAIRRAISDYAGKIGLDESNVYNAFVEDDILCGLTAIVNILHPYPEFESSTRYTLANPELYSPVFLLTLKAMESFAEKHPEQMRRIVEKCLKNKALRMHRRCGN